MALYKVVVEQKITKKVLVVVEANSNTGALDKARNGDIISHESTLDLQISEYVPIEAEKYS